MKTFNQFLSSNYPLLLVMCLIALASLSGTSWMMSFMAGFYIVFGAFKLLDLHGFAKGYAHYDLIAKIFKPWAYAYPFIEIALGFAFLFWFQMLASTWAALILSFVGALSAIQSVATKQTEPCACLGTKVPVPLSTLTILENVGMAGMAIWMLNMGM